MSAATSSGGVASHGHYLYGIIEASEEPLPSGVVGVDGGSPVTLLRHREVAAIVSEVPLAEFGARALEHNVKELPWLEAKTRAHEAVLERFLAAGPVLPARFCTIYRSPRHVVDVVDENYDSLKASLERVRGAREWGVKALLDRDAAVALARTRREAARPSGDPVGEGRAYFAARRLDQLVAAEVERMQLACAEDAHARLSACAREARPIHRAPSAERAGLILNAAYLVETGREPALEEELGRLRVRYGEHGIRFELTGPWPPYNFASAMQEAR